jgi:hypothetical protein
LRSELRLQSDFYVCPECGSFGECEHDGGQRGNPLKSVEENTDHDLYYEVLCNTEIPPHVEVFNTYGDKLSNAELLMQYGFILDPNDNDKVYFDLVEVARLFSPPQDSLTISLPQSDNKSFTESFNTSSLVFTPFPFQLEAELCIDSDGRISHQLWLFLVAHLCRNTSSEPAAPSALLFEDKLMEIATTQFGIEAALQAEGSNSVEQEDDDGHDSIWKSPFVPVLARLSRMVVRLCEAKKETIGHPKYVGEDLGEILDVCALIFADCFEAHFTGSLGHPGR